MGVSDSKVRNAEISEMLNFAFAQYETEQLLSKNSILGTVEIEKGTKKYVNVIPLDKVTILNKKGNQKKTATYELELGKIKAPIKNGDVIGELIIKENDQVTRRIGVTIKENVEKANLIQLYCRYLKDIFTGDIKI